MADDSFSPDYVLLHDLGGQGQQYLGDNAEKSPYNAIVYPDGTRVYRNPDNPYGVQAPHAYNFNPRSVGIAYAGQVGSTPTPEAMDAIREEVNRASQQHGIQPDHILSHGEAYQMTAGTPQQASKTGRDLDEASWRTYLRDPSLALPSNGPGAGFSAARGAPPPVAGGPPIPGGMPDFSGMSPYIRAAMSIPNPQANQGLIERMATNPMTLMGLSILGGPHQGWGRGVQEGASAANQLAMAREMPMRDMLTRAQIAQALSHAGFYDQYGQAMTTRANAMQDNAITNRIGKYGQVLQKLGPNPTESQWDQENKPGGLIYTAFGAPVPYSQAPTIIQKAKMLQNATPDEQTLIDQGFSPDAIKDMQRAKTIEGIYGPAKRGYSWTIDSSTGRPTQKLMAEGYTEKQALRDKAIPLYMQQLDQSRQVLANTNVVGRSVAHYTNGWAGYASTKEAMDQAGHAIAQLTAIVEGNRHANAQDVRFLQWFQPQPGDTNENIGFKLSQAQKIFSTYMSNKAAGRSDDYLGNRFSSQLQKAYEEGQKRNAPAPSNTAPGNPALRGMSDEELLRRLQQ